MQNKGAEPIDDLVRVAIDDVRRVHAEKSLVERNINTQGVPYNRLILNSIWLNTTEGSLQLGLRLTTNATRRDEVELDPC